MRHQTGGAGTSRVRTTAVAILLATVLFLLLPAARPQFQSAYYLPHIANGRFEGGSFRTTFIVFDTTDSYRFWAPLKLTDGSGNPLRLTIPELGTGSEFTLAVPGAGTVFMDTDGLGDLVVGAATLTSGSGLGVSAIFSVYDAAGNFSSEVGVAAATPSSQFVVPVDTVGLSNTGLALFNPGTGIASVDLVLRGLDGAEKARTHLDMNAGAHLARFVSGPGQLFPQLGEFRGTLSAQSSAPIASLGLKQNGSPPAYTSVPTLPASSTKTALSFPHVANGSFGGGSFKTSIIIFNTSATPASVDLAFTAEDGSPLPVTIPGKGVGSTFNYGLGPGASIFIQTDGSGPLRSGAATISSNVAVGAAGMFSVSDAAGGLQTEAGVGDAPLLKNMTVPIDVGGNRNTGVALFNPGSAGTNVTLRLIDEAGKIVGRDVSFALGGKSHIAKFATDWFPTLSTFTGSLTITSVSEIAALTLRQYSGAGVLSYTTLPLAAGTAQGSAPPLALLPATRTGINATSSATVDEVLQQGFRLSGNVALAAGAPKHVWARRASDGATTLSGVSGGGYTMAVGPGTYTLGLCFDPRGTGRTGTATIVFTDPVPLQVAADMSRDLTIPAVTLVPVSGRITGISNVFPDIPNDSFVRAVFTSDDRKKQATIPISDGLYSGVLPPGRYQAGFYVDLMPFGLPNQYQSVQVHDIGSMTVPASGTTADFALPQMANISGTIRGTAVTTSLGAGAMATDTSWIPDATSHSLDPPVIHLGLANNAFTGAYQMMVTQGRTFHMDALVALFEGTSMGAIQLPTTDRIVSVQGNTQVNFEVPTLPGSVTVSGRIADTFGRPVGNAAISMSSDSITGAPDITFIGRTETDSAGRLSMKVLSGTNYRLEVTPPAIR